MLRQDARGCDAPRVSATRNVKAAQFGLHSFEAITVFRHKSQPGSTVRIRNPSGTRQKPWLAVQPGGVGNGSFPHSCQKARR